MNRFAVRLDQSPVTHTHFPQVWYSPSGMDSSIAAVAYLLLLWSSGRWTMTASLTELVQWSSNFASSPNSGFLNFACSFVRLATFLTMRHHWWLDYFRAAWTNQMEEEAVTSYLMSLVFCVPLPSHQARSRPTRLATRPALWSLRLILVLTTGSRSNTLANSQRARPTDCSLSSESVTSIWLGSSPATVPVASDVTFGIHLLLICKTVVESLRSQIAHLVEC